MSAPGNREVAYRLFAAEFDDASLSYSESDEERAPNYVVTPSGARVNRLFVVGVLTEVEDVNEELLRGRISDPTGAFVTYAGQYQPEATNYLDRTAPPEFVALTGKARTYEPEDGDRVFTSVRPESVNTVDADTRDRWVVATARATLTRLGYLADALEMDARGDDLQVALEAGGVPPALSVGIPLAIDHYDVTTAYVEELRRLAVETLELVAGNRKPADVRTVSMAPHEGEHTEVGTLPTGIDRAAATAALESMEAASTTDTSPEAAAPSESVNEATAPGDTAGEAETASVGSEGSTAAEQSTTDDTRTDDVETSTSAAESDDGLPEFDTTSEPARSEPTDTPEPAKSETPEPATSETPEPATSETPEPATSETPEPATSETPEPATSETPEPATSETPEPTSDGVTPSTTATGGSSSTSAEDVSAGSDGPTSEPESSTDELGDFDVNDTDSVGEEDSEGDDGLSDFDTGDDDDLYEMDEETREQVESEFGTEFSSGAEVNPAGEADIDVPDPEELAERAEGAEAAVSSDEAVAAPPSASEPTTGTDSEPESDDGPSTTNDEQPTADDEPAAAEPDPEPIDDESEDESPAVVDPADVDLESVVVETMSDLDDGDGAERDAVVTAVVDEYGVDAADVSDAIQSALMSGRCYEPTEDQLKSI